MNLDDLNNKLDKIFFEGWEEFGIADPNLTNKLEYTDEEISNKAPIKYGFAYNKDAWNKLRTHPEYIQQVKLSISDILDQIDYLKKHKTSRPFSGGLRAKLGDTMDSLMLMSDIARDIAKDIGWRDINDIIISIQHHQFIIQLLKIREGLKQD